MGRAREAIMGAYALEVEKFIREGYERCANIAETFGDPTVAHFIRKAAAEVAVTYDGTEVAAYYGP